MGSSPRLGPMPDTPAMRELKKRARRYARAQATRDAARDALFAAIRAADAEDGTSRNAIARASGLARQTVFDVLHATEETAS